MKTLVLVGHPEIENSTTQQFLKAAAQPLSDVKWTAISEPIEVETQQALLKQADRIIFEFPLYWYSAPAILKLWEDRVLTNHFVVEEKALVQKEFGLVVNFSQKESAFVAGGGEEFTLSEILRPYQALAHKAQMKYLPIFSIPQFAYLTDEKRQRLLVDYQVYLSAPAKPSFDQKTDWLLNRLEASDFPANSQLVFDEIKNRQAELEDLKFQVSEIKAGELDE